MDGRPLAVHEPFVSAKHARHTRGAERIRPVHEVEVQVGHRRVPGITNGCDGIADGDGFSDANGHASAPQMGVERHTGRTLNENKIAG